MEDTKVITLENKEVILLDIEGTTTSISFVKEVLFPYIRRELHHHLEETWLTSETQNDVHSLKNQVACDVANNTIGMTASPITDDQSTMIDSLVKNIFAMMDADRKIGPLKTLQGHMWRKGYEDGVLKGHVYEDVVPVLEKWKTEGRRIYIYSSGSVEAQQLLFGHSQWGDLLHFFSGHFDTGVGMKVEGESYTNILQQLKCCPEKVLFLTDVAREAWAAKEVSIDSVLVLREGTFPLSTQDLQQFQTISSFQQLLLT